MWRFLQKLEIELPYDPAVPLLGIHTEETRSERDMCIPMFIAALFIIARTWKQPRCPSADKWMGKLWYIYTMISFRIDRFDLLAVQGTLKSLLQHHSSKASILWHSAFFIFLLSNLYMTTGKSLALTVWTFVNKMISLHFNMLSRFVIGFLPVSKCLNFMAAVTVSSDFGT